MKNLFWSFAAAILLAVFMLPLAFVHGYYWLKRLVLFGDPRRYGL